MGFKFKFPRHLFTPLLIYDAVNESSPPPPPPPPPPVWANVKVDPIVSYVQQVFQQSIAQNTQLTVGINTFSLQATGKGKIVIQGDLVSKQSISTDVQSRIVVNDTIVKNLQMNLVPMFANVLVPGGSNTSNLTYKLQVAVNQTITQQNIQNIIQSTFDSNSAKIYIRGGLMLVEGDLVSDQSIAVKVIAVNIIQAVIDATGEINVSDMTPTAPQSLNWLAFIIASVSSFICLIILVLIVTYGWSAKRGKK